MTGARRWGEQPRPPGRPWTDPRVRAKVLALGIEHPDWGSRRIAREAGASRRSAQRWLAAAGVRGAGAAAVRAPAESGPPGGESGPAERRSVALSAVLPMTEEDHRRFDAYRGAVYESPSVWWSGR